MTNDTVTIYGFGIFEVCDDIDDLVKKLEYFKFSYQRAEIDRLGEKKQLLIIWNSAFLWHNFVKIVEKLNEMNKQSKILFGHWSFEHKAFDTDFGYFKTEEELLKNAGCLFFDLEKDDDIKTVVSEKVINYPDTYYGIGSVSSFVVRKSLMNKFFRECEKKI